MSAPVRRRIFELDLLRGYFILVIIIDHLQFWPNSFTYITGEGRLWASAAEGFFLISGLLVGYIRAYKGQNTPLKDLAKKLADRALLLYLWGLGISLVVTLFTILVGAHPMLPKLPDPSQLASPLAFLANTISMNYVNDWIYFLRLYAIMLLITPVFLWLLRRDMWRVALAMIVSGYTISLFWAEAALQWQVLFFGAALIGWKLEAILAWLRARPQMRKLCLVALTSVTVITMMISYFLIHGWWFVEGIGQHILSRETFVAIRDVINPLFASNPMTIGRILLSFIWFGGLLGLFHLLRPWLLRFGGWLLLPLGERSLSAYCLQALLLIPIVLLVPITPHAPVNTLITAGVIILCWLLLRLRIVKKLLPT